MQPFNFQTDLRSQRKSKEPGSSAIIKPEFKAREMPNYKFFEPKKDGFQPTKFKEFDLSAECPAYRARLEKENSTKMEEKQFKALKVPNYEKASAQTKQ